MATDAERRALGDFEEDVAQHQQKRPGQVPLQLAQGVGDAQPVFLLDIVKTQPKLRPVAQRLDNVVTQMADDDVDVAGQYRFEEQVADSGPVHDVFDQE